MARLLLKFSVQNPFSRILDNPSLALRPLHVSASATIGHDNGLYGIRWLYSNSTERPPSAAEI